MSTNNTLKVKNRGRRGNVCERENYILFFVYYLFLKF